MLNMSDTFNLLIPVLVFWLDNCFNRTSEYGYFRDKSNFLWFVFNIEKIFLEIIWYFSKTLMCFDQLFAALSAWYMCAISFNRCFSVYRPLSYFLRISSETRRKIHHETDRRQETNTCVSLLSSFSSRITNYYYCCCCCLTRSIKYRQHLQAFRNIGIITLLGILSCLYPIFMHEIRSLVAVNQHVFDLKNDRSHIHSVIWKRCYYSRQHEYVYDIIGIFLSFFLHILPLTFVAAMNIMIIIKLRQRRRHAICTSTNMKRISRRNNKEHVSLNYFNKHNSYQCNELRQEIEEQTYDIPPNLFKSSEKSISTRKQKDELTITNSSVGDIKTKTSSKIIKRRQNVTHERRYSRDRTITIMLVSVALSYLILTLPYRLFWSYNIYIKHRHLKKLNSSNYLLRMYYIDHVLRTIRNIHYSTNFIFFIIVSNAFYRNFRQLFIENILRRVFNRNTNNTHHKSNK